MNTILSDSLALSWASMNLWPDPGLRVQTLPRVCLLVTEVPQRRHNIDPRTTVPGDLVAHSNSALRWLRVRDPDNLWPRAGVIVMATGGGLFHTEYHSRYSHVWHPWIILNP